MLVKIKMSCDANKKLPVRDQPSTNGKITRYLRNGDECIVRKEKNFGFYHLFNGEEFFNSHTKGVDWKVLPSYSQAENNNKHATGINSDVQSSVDKSTIFAKEKQFMTDIYKDFDLKIDDDMNRPGVKFSSLSDEVDNLSSIVTQHEGFITQVAFIWKGVGGVISESVGQLRNVMILNLSFNQISGSIPDSIGHMTSLTTLMLNNNKISGSIPESITRLKYLSTLNLSWNQITGVIPEFIGKLNCLTNLALAVNNLTGRIPESVGQLTKLEKLTFYKNQLSGTIPESICELTRLTELWLNVNRLSGYIPPLIGNLSNVTTLSLATNNLSGSLPSSIRGLAKVTNLCFNENELSGPIPESIGDLVQLQRLYLDANQFSGEIPDSIGKLVNLERLGLSKNMLSGMVPSSITKLTSIMRLNIDNNLITGFPEGLSSSFLKPRINQKSKLEEFTYLNNKIGYEDEIYQLLLPDQLRYLELQEKSLDNLIKDAIEQKLSKTILYMISKKRCNPFNSKGKSYLTRLLHQDPVGVYEWLKNLQPLQSDEKMYIVKEEVKNMLGSQIDPKLKYFEFPIEAGEYYIRSSAKQVVDKFWTKKIENFVDQIKPVTLDEICINRLKYTYIGLVSACSLVLNRLISLFRCLRRTRQQTEISLQNNNEGDTTTSVQHSVDDPPSTTKDNSNSISSNAVSNGEVSTPDTLMLERIYFADTYFKTHSFTLPLEILSNVEFLSLCVKASDFIDSVTIFDKEVIQVAIQYAWESYGFTYHMVTSCMYLNFLVLLSYSNYTFQDETNVGLYVVVILFNTFFFIVELIQCVKDRLEYLRRLENIFEMSGIIVVYIGCICRVLHSNFSRELLSVATIIVWFNLLNFFRPFTFTGPLVRMVFYCMVKILPFFLILLIILIGFSQSFYLLFFDDERLDFSQPDMALLHSFTYVLGASTYDLQNGLNPQLQITLQVIFAAFAQILLLNLLIAFLNSAYNEIKDNAKAEGYKERCRIIVDQINWFGSTMRHENKWIHYLCRQSDVKIKEEEKKKSRSTNVKLEEDLETLTTRMNNQSYHNYLELKKDVAELNSDHADTRKHIFYLIELLENKL